MRKVFLLLALIHHLMLGAQKYNEVISKAKDHYTAGNYLKSGKLYDSAFLIKPGSANDYYNATCSWALSGDVDKAFKCLNKALENGYHNKSWMMKDTDLVILRKNENWTKAIILAQQNLDEYEMHMNIPLKQQLEKLFIKDQTLRLLYQDAEKILGAESDEMYFFWELMARQDRLNLEEVFEIIDKHGWVGISEVGKKANRALWIVIQHADLEIQEKYYSFLEESVKVGESSASDMAFLKDRILKRHGKPQLYGTQVITDPETGKQVFHQIEDVENVDKRRIQVGLEPIKQYAKKRGVEWF